MSRVTSNFTRELSSKNMLSSTRSACNSSSEREILRKEKSLTSSSLSNKPKFFKSISTMKANQCLKL